ncbi:MAG TPA: hypothetical protein VMH05_05740 [Bryobacteraceae bacterium]|nr:hypothetical protein [Bryobacteraceae bacterium]
MRNRLLSSIAILVCFSAPAAAQATQTAAKNWTAPLTPDGHPDLQGTWLNKSATPIERPKQLEGREFLTDDEVAELQQRADKIFKDGRSDAATGDAVFLAALTNKETFKSATSTGDSSGVDREFDNRTSLIIDPPDGKIPPYTAAGRQRRAAYIAAAAGANQPASPQDLTLEQRCLSLGIPRLGGNIGAGLMGYYQIVQTPDSVLFFMEAYHDIRVIALDGRPHLPANIGTWEGDARGYWEGNTLVVDTTNFSDKTNFMGAGADLHLIERFTRVAPDEIRYEIMIDAPNTWVRPWTVMVRLKRTEEKIYEFACHEGNAPIMETMLSGVRGNPKPAEEAVKNK